MLDFIESALAAWRLAYMLVYEDGPAAIFSRLRYRAGLRAVVTKGNSGDLQASRVAQTWLAEALTCVWCLSVWAAALFLLPLAPVRWLRRALAVSGAAVVVHEAAQRLKAGD